ncbi:MAG: helicase-related protein [Caldilineaceae bacterium]
MTVREYKRICKQAGCGQEFTISAPSLEEDRLIGFSEPEYCPKHRALHARSYSRIACHHYELEMTRTGEELVRQIEAHKKFENERASELKGQVFDPWTMPGEGLGPGGLGRFQRPLRAFLGAEEYQPQTRVFQIAEKKDEILAALEDHQVIVLVGTTGSGKSTYVPWLLLTGGEPGKLSKWARRGPICVTQPRIQATRQVPRFIANALNGTTLGVGAQIGFSHSNAEEYDRRTRLIFQTDGKLINDIVSGAVSNYSIVMIDEAHERSVNIDLILGLLRDQLYLYPHLRVIIASATIDFGAFLGFFYPSLKDELAVFDDRTFLQNYSYFKQNRRIPFIYSEGRRFPIAEHWWGEPDLEKSSVREWPNTMPLEPVSDWWKNLNGGQAPTRDQFPQVIAELVQKLCQYLDQLSPHQKQYEDGHILVFLPGSREIDQTVSAVNELQLPKVIALPLYAQRPLDEQDAALNPDPKKHPTVYGKRRVVVSTNVAETSLTVEGVKYVIDTGYIKESYWNPTTEVSELQTVRHSQAGCRQRWGRAGRVSPGHTYMLYTKQQFQDSFPKDSSPSLARSSLEQVLLTAKTAGVRTGQTRSGEKVLDFTWMPLANAEDRKRFKEELGRAYDSLHRQKAIDDDGDLTRDGLELRGLPAAMDVARIFTEGERHAMGVEVATLLPFLKLDLGLQAILLWERDWDTYRKFSIRQHHLDLVYGCQDDLELYLKLWILWEAKSDKQRRAWEDEGGINYKNFQEQIEEERRKILELVMDWRKAEKRSISVKKINALRALIAYCLPHEIYLPIENVPQNNEEIDQRFRLPDTLMWEAYWEGDEQYEEYDEDVSFDNTYVGETNVRSGIYRRLNQTQRGGDESAALIEIAPTSICFGQADAELLIACQRRANFRRPARAKVLGMNMIRLQQEWLDAIQGSLIQRTLLYANLARRKDAREFQHLQERLFLPWILPRGSKVCAVVQGWEPTQGAQLTLSEIQHTGLLFAELKGKQLVVEGWIAAEEIDTNELPRIENGAEISAEVIGYEQVNGNKARVLLSHRHPMRQSFQIFAKRHKSNSSVQVEMRRVLEDPLGRSPLFIVREPTSGLEIPMADTDFCGNTHPQAYYGRRFEIGERFEADIIEIDPESSQVYLSRGRQLLREYAQIPDRDMQIIQVIVRRVDSLGAYLAIQGSGYIGFVRRALWSPGMNLKSGDIVEARLRRQDRHVNVQKLEQLLQEGQPLPSEVDLGVDLDLRIPPAYKQFAKQHRVGDIVTVTVIKVLDSGGLLVEFDEILKGTVFESELGLNENGHLKSAREYPLAKTIQVRVYQMLDKTAAIRCSIFRLEPIPHLEIGQVLEATVLMVREDTREAGLLRIICSWCNKYQVQAQAFAEAIDGPLSTGDVVAVRITKVDERVNMIQGVYER